MKVHKGYPTDRRIAHATPEFAIDGEHACAGQDPEISFPASQRYAEAIPALRICRQCPIRTACGTWAINTRQEFGVWGGMTPLQRRQALAANGGKW